MNITFAPNGRLQIDNARIIFRNFRGEGSRYNRDGDRNFSVVIDDEDIANALQNDTNKYGVGWNVKIRPPREEGDIPFMHLPVKVKFNDRGPGVHLTTGNRTVKLTEDTVDMLDEIDICSVNLDIRPYDNEVNGKPFRTAYLHSIHVIQEVDRFASTLYNNDEDVF